MSLCALLKTRQSVSLILQNKSASNASGLLTAVPKWSLELPNTTSNCHWVQFPSVQVVESTTSASKQIALCKLISDYTIQEHWWESTYTQTWAFTHFCSFCLQEAHTLDELDLGNTLWTVRTTKATPFPRFTTQLSLALSLYKTKTKRSSNFIAKILFFALSPAVLTCSDQQRGGIWIYLVRVDLQHTS